MVQFYPWLKDLHVATVILTGLLFVLRYYWMARERLADRGRWIGVLPHINDSLLLFSGIAMAVSIRQYPLTDAWLTAKLFALLAYIIIGSLALKRGSTRRIRLWAGLGALACYLYIVAVALSHSPRPSLELILSRLTT